MASLRSCMKTETKVKILGWTELVGALALLVGITVSYTYLFVILTSLGDRKIGLGMLNFYNNTRCEARIESDMAYSEAMNEYGDEGKPEPEGDKLLKDFAMWLIPEDVELVPENVEIVGMRVKSSLIGVFGATLTVATAAMCSHALATCALLVGTYTKKRAVILTWLILVILEFIALVGMVVLFLNALPILSGNIPFNLHNYFFILCLSRLYVDLAAHDLWKEMGQLTPKTAGLVPTLKGDDEPFIVSMALPDHCFKPKK